jgi:hypothetical protein
VGNIIDWLNGFLKAHDRNLERPDGRALYAYQLQEIEFEFLSSFLSASIKTVVGRHEWPSGTERLLVLYAAEWFRRRYDGGMWKWEDIFQSLDWPMLSAQERQKLAKDGLRYWQRDVFRHDSGHAAYLMTVVTEGGFPMRLVNQEDTHLNRYLKAVLSDYSKLADTGADAFKIAVAHGERLPLTFRKDPVYQLAADTIEVIFEYANKLSALNGSNTKEINAFEELEKHYPEWKQKLPISLESEGAKSLVNGLLSTAKKTQQKKSEYVLLKRFFKSNLQNDAGWEHGAKVELPFSLSKELISQQINVSVDNLPRRLELSMKFAHSLVPVASMTREKDDYYLYPYGVDSLSLMLKPSDEVGCFVMAYDGGKLGELNLRGGAALDLNLPLTCHMENGRLNVLGSGSIRSALEFVYTCMPSEASVVEGNGEVMAWNNIGFSGEWLKVTDRLRVALQGGFNCTIYPNTQSDEAQLCTIIGQRQYSCEAANLPCYAGFPKIILWQGGHNTSISKQQFYWSSLGKVANWKTAETEMPKGGIKYRIVIENECVQSGRIVVLPEDFAIKLQQGNSRLTGDIQLAGLQSTQVIVDTNLGVATQVHVLPGALSVTCTAAQTFAGKLPLEVIWPDLQRATIYVPFPSQGAHFVDVDGNDVSNKRQCLDDLIRLSAVAVCSRGNQRYALQGVLRAKDIKGKIFQSALSFNKAVHGQSNGYYELPLVNVLTSIRNLFSYSADLDASVLLEIVADGGIHSRIEVGQFSSELEFIKDTGQIVHKSNSGEYLADSFDVQLVSMAGGQVPEIQSAIINEENAYAYQLSDISGDISPCMAVMQGAAIRSVRPCVVFSTEEFIETEEDTELSHIFRLSTQWQRREALSKYLNIVATDAFHLGWTEILKAIRRFSEIHLDSLDLYEALIDNPVVIAGLVYRMNKKDIAMLMTWEDYIPFRWWQVPVASYILAFESYKNYVVSEHEDYKDILIEKALENLNKIKHFSALSSATIDIVLTCLGETPVDGLFSKVKGLNSLDLYTKYLNSSLKQQLFQSVGAADWPNSLNRDDWRKKFKNEVPWLDDAGDWDRRTFLDAIVAQAYSVVSNEYLPRDFRAFICAIREFNPQNFDLMMQIAIITFYKSNQHGK